MDEGQERRQPRAQLPARRGQGGERARGDRMTATLGYVYDDEHCLGFIAYLDIRDRLLPHTRAGARRYQSESHPMLRNLVVELTLRAPAGWRHAAALRARGRDSNGAGRGNE